VLQEHSSVLSISTHVVEAESSPEGIGAVHGAEKKVERGEVKVDQLAEETSCMPARGPLAWRAMLAGVHVTAAEPQHTKLQHSRSRHSQRAPSTHTAAHASSMVAESNEEGLIAAARDEALQQRAATGGKDIMKDEYDEDSDDDDEDTEEEPKLKYTRLTSSLGPVYRNGDATSAFMVAGDKMVRPTSPSFKSYHLSWYMY